MAPQSYAKVVRANMIERKVTTFVRSSQHQQHPPAMSTSPSKYVDCPAEFSPAPPVVTDAAPSAFTPVPSKKQRKRNNFKKDGVYQNGFVKTLATFKPKSDDFDFVIDAKGNDINENDKNDAITGAVENGAHENAKNGVAENAKNGAHENAKNGAIKEADKNDAINGGGKESAIHGNDHSKHAISKPVETKSNNGFVVNLDVDSSVNENIDDTLKAVEHPSKHDNLPVPINENDKHIEADKINSSTDNSSIDEEKNENDNHLENGHVDPDVHNNGGDYVDRGSSQGSNRFTVDDFQRLLFENSEGLYRMLGNEESFDRFNNFLKLMELSGGMELFCDVFENGEEHQHLPNIDPQQPLPELGRLPREKLDRAFRQLKKAMIQSYNSRIFFPQVPTTHFYPNPAANEFYPNAPPLSIISAPSSKSPHKIPTQKQIARRLTNCATAKSQQSHPQQQQHQSLQQQQLQCYIDPAHFDHQQQYFQLPPPTSTAIVPMHAPQQQQQQQQQCLQPLTTATTTAIGTYPQYLQTAPYHSYQPSPLPLATTNYTAVDFAQYINQRNMALLDELRANETMLSNLLYTG